MRPVKITIPGRFWDSQIYAGRLFLFTDKGSLQIVNWDRLVSRLDIDERLSLAVRSAFYRANCLYNSRIDKIDLLKDPDIRRVIQKKLRDLAGESLEVNISLLQECIESEYDLPCELPQSDSTIYYYRLFMGGRDGLFEIDYSMPLENAKNSCKRLWDCPILSLAASYSCLALATGENGLWQKPVHSDNHPTTGVLLDPEQLSKYNVNLANWLFQSIYGSSPVSGGILAEFEIERMDDEEPNRFNCKRHFYKCYSDIDIFGISGISWGNRNRFCTVQNRLLKVISYITPRERRQRPFRMITELNLPRKCGDVIGGAIAAFGIILEHDTGLVVLPSDSSNPVHIDEEPVSWRVFPRAKFYQNQMHVVLDDRLEAYSFNNDYFVSQRNKTLGSRPLK